MAKSLTAAQLNTIVRKQGKKLKNGQYMLTSPLKVFKKVYTDANPQSYYKHTVSCIANLIIPIGAIVNLCNGGEKKFRASQAYCHSIFEVTSKKEVATAYSSYDNSFKYHSGKKLGLVDSDFEGMVLNDEDFNKFAYSTSGKIKIAHLKKCKVVPDQFTTISTGTCNNGVHFFHEIQSAINY